ncbi:MAG: hypothetical protein R3F59_37050, partial [Myxococcota bacterium]
ATIDAWVARGARLGRGDADAVLASEVPALDDPDLVLQTAPYAPVGHPDDDYRCYVLARGIDAVLTAVELAPEDASVVHHANLSAVTPWDGGAALLALDDADPGAGFDCNEGKGAGALQGDERKLLGWGPGRGPTLLPAGTGLPLGADDWLLMTVHYNVTGGVAGPAPIRVALRTAEAVDQPLARLKLMDPAWKDGAFEVLPGEVAVHTYEVPVRDAILDGLDPTGGLWVHSASLHMHLRGVTASASLRRAGGGEVRLLDIPRWDFDQQLDYLFREPVLAGPDDTLVVSCTQENVDGTEAVTWGPDTSNEMCGAPLFVSAP